MGTKADKIRSYNQNLIHNVEAKEIQTGETKLAQTILYKTADASCPYNVTLEFSDTKLNPDVVEEIRGILKNEFLKKLLTGAGK